MGQHIATTRLMSLCQSEAFAVSSGTTAWVCNGHAGVLLARLSSTMEKVAMSHIALTQIDAKTLEHRIAGILNPCAPQTSFLALQQKCVWHEAYHRFVPPCAVSRAGTISIPLLFGLMVVTGLPPLAHYSFATGQLSGRISTRGSIVLALLNHPTHCGLI